MTDPREIAERALAIAKPRDFYSVLFNIANAYNQAADSALASMSSTCNADFASPAIMCRSFAIEVLLKFFIAAKYPDKGFKELKAAGINLRGHRYSSLFDQIESTVQNAIADTYAEHVGSTVDAAGFRGLLVVLGDEPFVTWRYIYEAEGISHVDLALLAAVTLALGLAAQAVVRNLCSQSP